MTYTLRSQTFEEGRRAAWDGKPYRANPYAPASAWAILWGRGWDYVQRPGRAVDLSNPDARTNHPNWAE